MTTNDSAQAVCDRTGLAVIEVNYFNNSSKNIAVAAKDSQSGYSVELNSIKPRQLASGEIITGKQILSDSKVIFTISPTNSDQSTTSSVLYNGLTCNTPFVIPSTGSTGSPFPTSSGSSIQIPVTITATVSPLQLTQRTEVTVAPNPAASQLPSTGAGINSLFFIISFIIAGLYLRNTAYH